MVMRESTKCAARCALLSLLAALSGEACGGSDPAPSRDAQGGAGGASGSSGESGVAGTASGAGGSAGETSERTETAGAGGQAGDSRSNEGAGEAGAADGESSATGGQGGATAESDGGAGAGGGDSPIDPCNRTAPDLPDDDFVDSDCDGIDGERDAGIFVAPTGNDSTRGTIAEPVRTLQRAVALAQETKLPLYVCNGSYRENLAISAPVAIYGGYDCTREWLRTKDHAVVDPGAGAALSIASVPGPVHIERLAFRALAGTASGQSSQAAAISDSSAVTLARVELQAGAGAPGAAGIPGEWVSMQVGPRRAGRGAASGDCTTSSSASACNAYPAGGFDAEAMTTCAVDGVPYKLRGGRGGTGGNLWLTLGKPSCVRGAEDGASGQAGEVAIGDGDWQSVRLWSGLPGADGEDGLPASLGIGTLIGAAYEATNRGSDGKDGLPGYPGFGGSGGLASTQPGDICYATFKTGAGGGQGAAGSCGGGRARGGGGGGGSLALVIVNSHVELRWPRIVTGDGGNGGDGALGALGPEPTAPSGLGGVGADLNAGRPGNPGGRGGQGGDGGSGGGGPSIGILYVGEAPTVSDAVYSIGLPGNGGKARSVRDGADGVTSELYRLEP
jgi:hypothetical protein